MSTNQAIVRKVYTVAATFTGKPTEEERRKLKAAGAEFKNGQWVRTASDAVVVDESEVAKLFG